MEAEQKGQVGPGKQTIKTKVCKIERKTGKLKMETFA
jgi:hypothetical protein